MLNKILNIGVNETMLSQKVRQVRLTNMIILFLSAFSSFLMFPILFEDGIGVVAFMNFASLLILFLFMWINYKGKTLLSRVLISIYPPIIAMSATILIKRIDPFSIEIYDFLDARILIVGFAVLPFILFSLQERKYIFYTLLVPVFFSIAFDPIHTFFGVGFSNFFGAFPKQYIVISIYIDLVLVFVAGSIYYLLKNIDELMLKNSSLIKDLGSKNMELSALFEDQENLNKKLRDNERLIEEQKSKLLVANEQLSEEVSDKSVELKQSNEELIKHNNGLQQFSSTLSHNLRGPVANLLGLSNLFKIDKSEDSRKSIAEHINKSAAALDTVIKDLNKIVELRNNLFQIKEKIEIHKEIEDIWLVLESSVKQSAASLHLDIKAPITYGVRSYFHSILYNLISNAIKYRNPNNDCEIKVSTRKVKGNCVISVQDNGIGVDLEKYRDKIFGMYKRFHTHIEGKGLGLFLTKQQIESMGGEILIESELNVGTRFIIKFPAVQLSEIESQLFYRSSVANIYLDVVNSITTFVWKKMPNPEEFKEVFANNVEVFSSYNSDKWIVKLELLDDMPEAEKQWILDNAIDAYANVGVKTIAIIRDLEGSNEDFWLEFARLTKQKSVEVIFVNSFEKAKEKLIIV